MLKISELGFNNLEEISFVMPPKCECENCNEDLSLVVKKGNTIEGYATSILYELECSHVGSLILGNKNETKVILPKYLFNDEHDSNEFVLSCLSINNNNFSKEEIIDDFVDIVNKAQLHNILILQEDMNDRNVYNFIYK